MNLVQVTALELYTLASLRTANQVECILTAWQFGLGSFPVAAGRLGPLASVVSRVASLRFARLLPLL